MSEGQKVIKYLAIAFAIFLSVNIIGGIISAVFLGFTFLDKNLKEENGSSYNMDINQKMTFSQKYDNIEKLKIEVGYSNLQIKKGETFKVESNSKNENISIKKSSKTLLVKEDVKWKLFYKEPESYIIITVPENFYLEQIEVNAGSGILNISNVETKSFKLDVGAGSVEISNILVEKETKINGGAGKLIIKDSTLNKLDLKAGVGELQILNTKVLNDSNINAGVGKLQITLNGDLEDYKIIPKRGIGSFLIDNKEVVDDKIYGDGDNKIKINAGIGKIEISFEN